VKLLQIIVGVTILSMIMLLNNMGSVLALNQGIYDSESSPYGTPYSKWIEKWWSWWVGIPNDKHPAKDYSNSERCSLMQDGPVWYLPDVLPAAEVLNYHCDIPAGKAILLPITTTSCDKGTPPTMTDDELRECADNILTPPSNMKVMLDGKEVNVSNLLGRTGFYNVTYPVNPIDIWGPIKPGTYRAIATGYFLFLHDLSPGKHNITLHVVDLLKGNEGPPPRFDPPRDFSFDIFIK
jgi:hypothetical protein